MKTFVFRKSSYLNSTLTPLLIIPQIILEMRIYILGVKKLMS